ncbi:MAG: SMEK domain-containing protein [Rhodobacteraceae bacterium]|nr:SMEK domain-containing protein [Paracoccaceae bacterium]
MERQKLINTCIDRLVFLKSKVEVSSKLNLTDMNIHSENFYRDFLNLLYEYDLKNINKIQHNATSIDLVDQNNKIAIQVTSTPNLAKTKKTVDSFISKKLYEKYERLVILNIVKKTQHSKGQIGEEGLYQLDTNRDIWDVFDSVIPANFFL